MGIYRYYHDSKNKIFTKSFNVRRKIEMLPIKIELDDSYFKEEIRCEYRVTEQRKEMWAIELDLLVEFDHVCKKNNLKYFIDGGTLLGAVRHQGFIPWDDDVDVIMLREDYDKLVRIGNKEFKHPYFFQSAYSDRGYTRGHSQLRNSLTCGALKKEAKRDHFNQGMFLDIFVLDGLPEREEELDKQFKMLRNYMFQMKKIFYPQAYGNYPKYILKWLRKEVYLHTNLLSGLYKKFEKCAKAYGDSEDVYLITFYEKREQIKRFKKEWYSEVIYMPFEMLKCPVPVGYKNILEGYYGKNYIKPVQVANDHGQLICSTKKSYKEVLENI